jgi:hypothetical protein
LLSAAAGAARSPPDSPVLPPQRLPQSSNQALPMTHASCRRAAAPSNEPSMSRLPRPRGVLTPRRQHVLAFQPMQPVLPPPVPVHQLCLAFCACASNIASRVSSPCCADLEVRISCCACFNAALNCLAPRFACISAVRFLWRAGRLRASRALPAAAAAFGSGKCPWGFDFAHSPPRPSPGRCFLG